MRKITAAALQTRAKDIKLVGMDVDGVLTAGEIILLESGEEVKLWNSKDRLVLSILRDRKDPLVLAWITGRTSKAVSLAAADLGVGHVVQGCHTKKDALAEILREHNLDFRQAAYIGDDLIDLSVLGAVGFSACPSDASDDVRESVHYVSPYSGGKGVVRDVLKFILKAQKRWNPILESLRR